MSEERHASEIPCPPAPDAPAPQSGVMTVVEVTGLVNLFAGMLNTSTTLILGRLDDNAKLAAERWVKHDAELERNREVVVARFLMIEKALDAHLQVANAHFAKAHDDDLVLDARVRPMRTVAQSFAKNWRTVLLFIVALLAILGFSGETVQKLLGG